jgi:hypothetical protein
MTDTTFKEIPLPDDSYKGCRNTEHFLNMIINGECEWCGSKFIETQADWNEYDNEASREKVETESEAYRTAHS